MPKTHNTNSELSCLYSSRKKFYEQLKIVMEAFPQTIPFGEHLIELKECQSTVSLIEMRKTLLQSINSANIPKPNSFLLTNILSNIVIMELARIKLEERLDSKGIKH